MNYDNTTLNLAIPSDGAIHEPTLSFLSSCGVAVLRPNSRKYTADMPTLPGVTVMFQRNSDITGKVEDGTAALGIVGLDRFLEIRQEGSNTDIVIEKLGFGQCELVIGVPDSWIDVTSLGDIGDLSMQFREKGTDIKIATKYPRLLHQFLLSNGVTYFSLVESSGTLEAAPAMGYADIIADISSTGTTMKENGLKLIKGGAILSSEACLIANYDVLPKDSKKLALAKSLIDFIEAHLKSRELYSVTTNMKGDTADSIADHILKKTKITGLRGPTISKVYTQNDEGWFAVTIIVDKKRLLDTVRDLRNIGGTSVTVSQPNYVFQTECNAHSTLT